MCEPDTGTHVTRIQVARMLVLAERERQVVAVSARRGQRVSNRADSGFVVDHPDDRAQHIAGPRIDWNVNTVLTN